MTHTIVSVLGEARAADVRPGDGYPWISCPFCQSAVYLETPHPDHTHVSSIGVGGRCANPWCIANPKMPLDAARLAIGAAHLRQMESDRRTAEHVAAMERIAAERASWDAAHTAVVREARDRGACVRCASLSFRRGRVKYTRHRGTCPGAARQE